jgi:hypothetical protein
LKIWRAKLPLSRKEQEKWPCRSLALPKTKFFNGLSGNRSADIADHQEWIVSRFHGLSLLLVLFSVFTAGGCAKLRRGLDWARYENRLSLFVTPLYRIPSGFSSSYHRHLYGDERVWGDGEQVETIPMENKSGTLYPSKADDDPMSGPDIVRPTVPVGKSDPAIQQAIDSRRRNLLR